MTLPTAVSGALSKLPPALADAWLICFDPLPYPALSVGANVRPCSAERGSGTCVLRRDDSRPENIPKALLWQRHLSPSAIEPYAWLALWDTDVAPHDTFDFRRYVAMCYLRGDVGVSQPLLLNNAHWSSTLWDQRSPLDSRLQPATAEGVEQMCPVYAVAFWRCVWPHISSHPQHTSGFGIGQYLHRACARTTSLQQYLVAQLVNHNAEVTNVYNRTEHAISLRHYARVHYELVGAAEAAESARPSPSTAEAQQQPRRGGQPAVRSSFRSARPIYAPSHPARPTHDRQNTTAPSVLEPVQKSPGFLRGAFEQLVGSVRASVRSAVDALCSPRVLVLSVGRGR